MSYRNYSGVPLGGIGAGKIEWCPDGAFRNITTQNNWDNPITVGQWKQDTHEYLCGFAPEFSSRGIEGSFLGVYVDGVGMLVLKEDEDPLYHTVPVGSIRYQGRFPTIHTDYKPWGGINIAVDAWSGLNLGDADPEYKNSALPAAVFIVTLTNRSEQSRYVAATFSWAHIVGVGGYPQARVHDLRDNTIHAEQTGDFLHLIFDHARSKVDARIEGHYALTVPVQPFDSSYLGWSTYIHNWPSHPTLRNTFGESGILPQLIVQEDRRTGLSGAVALGHSLAPGESISLPFVLSWYFPHFIANHASRINYGQHYTKWFQSAVEIGEYTYQHRLELRENVHQWQDRLAQSSLPSWFVEKLMNDLFPLYTNTLWGANGKFSVSEAPTDMRGCLGTLDQRASASFIYTYAFPRLAKSELDLFVAQQIGDDHPERFGVHWDTQLGKWGKSLDRLGAIRHDIGWESFEGGSLGHQNWLSLHWPDIPLLYILQLYHFVTTTGDQEQARQWYTSAQRAYDFYCRLDQDHDGIAELWGPGSCTYDNEDYPYYGASAYIGGLTLAAQQALMAWAKYRQDRAQQVRLERDYRLTYDTMVNRLWDSQQQHFFTWQDAQSAHWTDPDRIHQPRSSSCHVAQLAGQWFSALLDLPAIASDSQRRQALKAIDRANVAPIQYCPADEAFENGKLSQSWPYYVETYYIATAVYAGLDKLAWTALKKIYDAMYEHDQSPWNAALTWAGSGNGDRRWGQWYMTNPASWYVLESLLGVHYNRLTHCLTFRRASAQLEYEPESKLPVFLPGIWLTLKTTNASLALTCDRVFDSLVMNISAIVLPTDYAWLLYADGSEIAVSKTENVDNSFREYRLKTPITWKSGGTLTCVRQ
ncbi:MAG: hypothetical protein C7B45_06805 [Sulfobacillus acidophilus]|uniref:Glycosyl-hydrolase family 116 catalytic region domain-containing protein n=1 Tax=Sulfobacillus acidophilus TaxID=53633 RepID=A0A2T2WJL5_9FIRM|nr:MAG: hypothetical protein C7B45_06805 [Sulfobacillus acidophilus]